MTELSFTSADLELFPDDGKRYEIIDGELYVSRPSHYYHQLASALVACALQRWSSQTGAGSAVVAPGVIFSSYDDVAPDAVWVSKDRLPKILGSDGKLHSAPELVIEVLSGGPNNERRDRETKLNLYSRRGVSEYWIVNWRAREIEIYQRKDAQLQLSAILIESDELQSPLLPGFSYRLSELFGDFPSPAQENSVTIDTELRRMN